MFNQTIQDSSCLNIKRTKNLTCVIDEISKETERYNNFNNARFCGQMDYKNMNLPKKIVENWRELDKKNDFVTACVMKKIKSKKGRGGCSILNVT